MTARARAGGLAITDAMRDVALFGRHFSGATWAGWETFSRALFALPMSEDQAALYRRCTGRSSLPTSAAREGWIVAGRRAGKSRMSAFGTSGWARSLLPRLLGVGVSKRQYGVSTPPWTSSKHAKSRYDPFR